MKKQKEKFDLTKFRISAFKQLDPEFCHFFVVYDGIQPKILEAPVSPKNDLSKNFETLSILLYIFEDAKKVREWLQAKNPHFGNKDPLSLMKMGRGNKVFSFVSSALEENRL